VSEWTLNGTSAQLCYTVSFTLVHVGKYRTEDKLQTLTINAETKHKTQTCIKSKQHKTQQNKN